MPLGYSFAELTQVYALELPTEYLRLQKYQFMFKQIESLF